MNSSAANKPAGRNLLLLCMFALTRPLNLLPTLPKTIVICIYAEETRSYSKISAKDIRLCYMDGLEEFFSA